MKRDCPIVRKSQEMSRGTGRPVAEVASVKPLNNPRYTVSAPKLVLMLRKDKLPNSISTGLNNV